MNANHFMVSAEAKKPLLVIRCAWVGLGTDSIPLLNRNVGGDISHTAILKSANWVGTSVVTNRISIIQNIG